MKTEWSVHQDKCIVSMLCLQHETGLDIAEGSDSDGMTRCAAATVAEPAGSSLMVCACGSPDPLDLRAVQGGSRACDLLVSLTTVARRTTVAGRHTAHSPCAVSYA